MSFEVCTSAALANVGRGRAFAGAAWCEHADNRQGEYWSEPTGAVASRVERSLRERGGSGGTGSAATVARRVKEAGINLSPRARSPVEWPVGNLANRVGIPAPAQIASGNSVGAWGSLSGHEPGPFLRSAHPSDLLFLGPAAVFPHER